jgi:hypothetical protein
MNAGDGDDPSDLSATDADDLLRDARAFVADEASLLAGLSGILDELADAESAEADSFDTEAMWARLQRQLWADGS